MVVNIQLVLELLNDLPSNIERLRLKSVELTSGHSLPFWQAMGFKFAYINGELSSFDDVSDVMVRGVNNHPTQPMQVLTESDFRGYLEEKGDIDFIKKWKSHLILSNEPSF